MASTAQEIALMKQRMDSFEEKIDSLDNKIDNLTQQLLNPDDGFVSRVNKNTEARVQKERDMAKYEKIMLEFKEMQRWKDGVNKALWVLYTAIIGSAIAYIFA
jgi:predicted  nucleic acid-binding Zn-ribbon protein